MKKILLVSFFVLLSLVGLYYAKISLTLICIGIIAAFIGTLAGGGGLITLPAMMLVGIPIQTSIATNKFSTGISALSSIFYLLYHKELHLKAILKYIAIAGIGGVGGALLAVSLSHLHKSRTTHSCTAFWELYRSFYCFLSNWFYSMALCHCHGTRLYPRLSIRPPSAATYANKNSQTTPTCHYFIVDYSDAMENHLILPLKCS